MQGRRELSFFSTRKIPPLLEMRRAKQYLLRGPHQRTWYFSGTQERSIRSEVTEVCEADFKQQNWQSLLQRSTVPNFQSKSGLCSLNQGRPNIIGCWGEWITWNWRCSWWLPESTTWTGEVLWVMQERRRPSRALASTGVTRGSQERPSCLVKEQSIKFPPKQNRAGS